MAVKMVKEVIKSIKPGSKEHEAYLSVGYGFGKEEAESILAAYKDNPSSVSLKEQVLPARAYMAALTAGKSKPVSTRPGWKRTKRGRNR